MIIERMSKMENSYFEVKEHLEPIFIFTSNLKHKDKRTGTVTRIYDSVNKYLRTESILNKKHE
jgi:hypothetical protein